MSKLFSLYIAIFVIVFSSFSAQAGQREDLLETFVKKVKHESRFDAMMGANVDLKNHYLSWRKDGMAQSLNAEFLQDVFTHYHFQAKRDQCEAPTTDWIPTAVSSPLTDRVPKVFLEKFKRMFGVGTPFYSHHSIDDREIRSEAALLTTCEFSILGSLSLPFDPAGLGGLKRDFVFKNASEKAKSVCRPIVKQMLADIFDGRTLKVFSVPRDMKNHPLCVGFQGTESTTPNTSDRSSEIAR